MIDLEQHKIFLQDQGIYVIPHEIVQQYVEQLHSKVLDEVQTILNTLDATITGLVDDLDIIDSNNL